jgi:hypothetical protein
MFPVQTVRIEKVLSDPGSVGRSFDDPAKVKLDKF